MSEGLAALARRLREGSLEEHLARLETLVGEREPQVLALTDEPERFARLRRQAAELVERWPDASDRPSLFGVPVGIKEVFRVEGLPTTAGSRLPPEELAGDEAVSVKALRRAGALVLGKTASTEFAFFAPGPTRNPHHLEHTPGGSSSGSAAAVAAGYCPLALGTQTYGSVTRPAAFCGVVGFKPSFGRISCDGVVPLAPSLDHVGTFTTDVEGAEIAAAVLCREWGLARQDSRPVLAVPEGPFLDAASDVGRERFEELCSRLEEAGLEVLRVPALADLQEIRTRHELIVAAEAALVHRRWYPRHRDLYGERLRNLIELGQGIAAAELDAVRTGREKLRRELTSLMARHTFDLWISPAAPGPAPRGLESTGDPAMNLPWTHAGLPTLTLPAGDVDGLPLGLQLVAGWWLDERLLGWGRELEEVLRGAGGTSA